MHFAQVLVAACLVTTGCWRTHSYSQGQGLNLLDGSHSVALVTDRDTVHALRARVERDTIWGLDPANKNRRVAVAVADVRSMTMSRFNATDTSFLVVGLMPILLPVIYGILLSVY